MTGGSSASPSSSTASMQINAAAAPVARQHETFNSVVSAKNDHQHSFQSHETTLMESSNASVSVSASTVLPPPYHQSRSQAASIFAPGVGGRDGNSQSQSESESEPDGSLFNALNASDSKSARPRGIRHTQTLVEVATRKAIVVRQGNNLQRRGGALQLRPTQLPAPVYESGSEAAQHRQTAAPWKLPLGSHGFSARFGYFPSDRMDSVSCRLGLSYTPWKSVFCNPLQSEQQVLCRPGSSPGEDRGDASRTPGNKPLEILSPAGENGRPPLKKQKTVLAFWCSRFCRSLQ